VGSAPFTIGVTLQQFFIGHQMEGMVMAGFAVLVGVIDNFVRPIVLKGGANLHPLLGFVAALGGLQTMGFSGVFLGPIIAGTFITLLKISNR
jgi:predicted PurR-regulated permease PerM